MLWLRDPGLCDVEAKRLLFQKINIAGLSQSNTHLPADRLIIFPPIWWQLGEFSIVITGMFSHPLDTYSLLIVAGFIQRTCVKSKAHAVKPKRSRLAHWRQRLRIRLSVWHSLSLSQGFLSDSSFLCFKTAWNQSVLSYEPMVTLCDQTLHLKELCASSNTLSLQHTRA